MTNRLIFFLALLLTAMIFVGCGDKDKEEPLPVNAELPESTVEHTTIETEPELDSGEESISDDEFVLPAAGVRPIAVMIDNQGSKVLPQGGIDKAQIVYEIIVEGGITRFMAVFWGTDAELIGPVRSSRHYFLDFSMEHDAIYTHVGWSPMAQKDIANLKIANVNGLIVSNEVIWDLTKDKNNWQDSYSSIEKLSEYSSNRGYRTVTDTAFPFQYNTQDVVLEKGENATEVSLKYSGYAESRYEYNMETGKYKRFRQGKPHMERVSEKQVEVKNIVIRFTKNFTIPGDKEGRQDMVTTGSGDGWFITCGKAVKIKWSKESRSSQTKYTDEAGNNIKLNKGQTWIQVMPLNAQVTIE